VGRKTADKKRLDNHEMIRAIHDGKLRSMYIKGEDTITSDANSNDVSSAFKKLEFMVMRDVNFSETCAYADVILPASPSLEKEGTFTNTERLIQRLYRALDPLGESKPDWEIIQLIANRMGAGWAYQHPSQIMDEAAPLVPLFAGVNYERLEGYKSLQWPVAKDGKDSPVLFTEKFPFPDGKAHFHPIEWVEPCEVHNAEFSNHLNNGRLLEHFEQGSMTYRTKGLKRMTPRTFVEVSPEHAKTRGMETGTMVHLRSPAGEATVPVLVTDRVEGSQLYMPLNSVLQPVNRLTGAQVDRATHTPAYKETSVKMTIVEKMGPSPLPAENFRNGKRTPQSGVEIERKWKRADYSIPGTSTGDKLVQIKTTTV
jgi:formate dehydrogenase major subunit